LEALVARHQRQHHHLDPRRQQQRQHGSREQREAQGGAQPDQVVLALERLGEIVGLFLGHEGYRRKNRTKVSSFRYGSYPRTAAWRSCDGDQKCHSSTACRSRTWHRLPRTGGHMRQAGVALLSLLACASRAGAQTEPAFSREVRGSFGGSVNPLGLQQGLEVASTRPLSGSSSPLLPHPHLSLGLSNPLTPAY